VATPKLYGVYTARFPYLERSKDKVRPVAVVSRSHGEFGVVAIVPISSKSDLEIVDVRLSGLESAGLAKASVARVHRLTTMLQADLIAELGQLSSKDIQALKASLRKFLEL